MRPLDRLRWRRRHDEDLQDEIASHLALAVRDRIAAGEDPQAARLAARKEFGNVTLTREATRRSWGGLWIDRVEALFRDLRYALRQLARSPAYSLVVIAVLGLGIGTNLVVFGLFKALALTPLGGVTDARDLHFIGARTRAGQAAVQSYPDFQDLRVRSRAYSGLAASSIQPIGLGIGERRDRIWVELVGGDYFDVLGIAAQLGRTLQAGDERVDGDAVVVLADGPWRHTFGADPEIVGRTIHLNSQPVTVIGVAAPDFRGSVVGLTTDAFVPVTMGERLSACCDLDDRRNRWLQVFGRLRPGTSVADARSDVDRLSAQLADEHPIEHFDARAVIVSLWRWPYGAQTFMLPAVSLMGAMSALLLVVVCANAAGLVLVRSLSRRREIATRLVLGASRGRVLRLLTVESLALAIPGALLGLAFPWLVVPFIDAARAGVPVPLHFNAHQDGVIVAAALVMAVVCAVLYGGIPATTALRVDLAAVAREDVSPRGAPRSRLRTALVVSQVAMSLILLVGTGLVVRSLDRARQADVGFDPSNVGTAVLDLRLNGYDAAAGSAAFARLLDTLRAEPAVEAASLAAYLPLTLIEWEAWDFSPEGYQQRQDEDLTFLVNFVSPNHFRTLRIPLAAGRDFDDRDDDTAPPVAIVNETLARRFWGAPAAALGRRLQTLDGASRTIVGVARDAKYARVNEDPRPYVYLPFPQEYRPAMTLQLRSAAASIPPLEVMRRHVQALDPGLPLLEERMLADQMRFAASIYELVARVLAIVGAIAIGLAALGIYGVVAFTVSQHTHDIAVRIAIGATRTAILRRFLVLGLRLGIGGAIIGVVAALAGTRLMRSLLYGVGPGDLVSFVSASALVLAVALAASLVPAWRASRTDPASTLRHS